MAAATDVTQPARHVLALPDDCDCGLCTPSWARRRGKSRRYTDLVTLTAALGREEPAARPAMVAQHLACLLAMTSAAASLVTALPDDQAGAPGAGLPLLMFAGELAAAVQPGEFRAELPAGLIAASEQAVTTATLAAAGCLAELVDAVQALSALAS